MSVDTKELRRLREEAANVIESLGDGMGTALRTDGYGMPFARYVAQLVCDAPYLLDALDDSVATIAERDKEIERLREQVNVQRSVTETSDWHREQARLEIVELRADNASLTAENAQAWEQESQRQIEYDKLFDEATAIRKERDALRERCGTQKE